MSNRDDFLVSVCLADAPNTREERQQLCRFADELDKNWRYWEILVVCDVQEAAALEDLLEKIKNLRLLIIRGDTHIYRRRVIAASEAIGDLIAITNFEELPHVNLTRRFEDVAHSNAIQVCRRSGRRLFLGSALVVLGRSSGYRVHANDTQTAIFPRALLSRILARSDRQIALRFLPRDLDLPFSYFELEEGVLRERTGGVRARIGILQKLVIESAPSFLNWIGLLSVIVCLASLCFAIYAMGVWAFKSDIQPGWFTTSLAISMSSAFLGASIFALTAGFLKLFDLLTPDSMDDVIDEKGHADIFARVTEDLNIEKVEQGEPEK